MVYDPERIVNIGELERRGKTVRFGIKEKDRSRHIYVIGQTGTGKSTLLEMLAMQDIRNGTGLIFMDPHGQSVEALLNYVTQDYLDNIIYFAPHHQERPIGLNIMEDIGYDKRHLVVSSLMASFEKIWGAGTWSDRMAYILQNTLLALIEYPGTTLLDVGRMYSSKGFREKVVANLKDPQVRKYWVEEFANYTERYAQEATPSIQNKLGQFTSNPLMRNIIGQKESAFNFREIMDEGKILLVNLSKGQIGENNARMLGVLFTTKIYLAALSRSDMAKSELEMANPCNFFVDEFQSFANSSFSDILSEARKYKLNLVMAHQYLGQLYSDDSGGGDVIRDAVFGNVGTFISFRVGPVDAEIISKQFAPDILEEDLVALPRYHIYLTLNIDGAGSAPFSARTFYEPAPEGVSLEEQVVQRTMDVYGVDRAVVEKMVEDNLAEDAQLNELAQKAGGQKGAGRKSGWQQSGGKQTGGQRGSGRQTVRSGDQRSAETHTPLKGLVQQMMQREGSQKIDVLRGSGSDNEEKVANKEKDVPDRMKMEKSKIEKSKERVEQKDRGGGGVKKRSNTPSDRQKVNEQKNEVGKGLREEVGVLAVAATEEIQKSDGQRDHKQNTFDKQERVRAASSSETKRSSSRRGRGKRGRGSGGAVSGFDQNGGERKFSSERGGRHYEDVAVQRDGQVRDQRGLGRRGAVQDTKDVVRDVRRRQSERQQDRGEDGVQRQKRQQKERRRRGGDAARKKVVVENERGGSAERKEIDTKRRQERKPPQRQRRDTVRHPIVREKVENGDASKRREKTVVADARQSEGERAQRRVKEYQSQPTSALRRPSGVVVGTVSRSVVAQQSNVEQDTTQSDTLGGQQGLQDTAPKRQENPPVSGGGLGDLVKTAKASGLRRDLRVTAKKGKPAPPVSYEEGWVAIGDITSR